MKLAKCFFCKAVPTVKEVIGKRLTEKGDFEQYTRYQVSCTCGASGKIQDTKDAAVKSWNEPWQQSQN